MRMPLFDREAVASRAAYLTVYAGEVTHLEWYQTPKFLKLVGIVLFVIAIVMSPFTGGQSLSLYAVAMTILFTIAVNLVLRFVLQKLMEWFPDDVGLQVAAAVVLAITAIALTGDMSAMSNLELALMATTQVAGYVSDVITFQSMKEKKAFEKELSRYTNELEHIEDKWDEMFPPNLFTRWDELKVFESPEEFEYRTEMDDLSDYLSDTYHLTVDDPDLYRRQNIG